MAKRGNSEGSIYRRASDGQYVASIRWIDPDTGAARRSTLYGRTRAEVRTKLREALERRHDNAPVKDATTTVGVWAQAWLATALAASPRKETTKELYGHLIRGYVVPPPFGARRLDRLRPTHVEQLILALRSRKKIKTAPDGTVVEVRALADATVQKVFTVVRLVLDGAVRDGLMARNPAAVVKAPAIPPHEARFLSLEEVGAILDAARGTRYSSLFTFIAATGVRKGEALALRWSDVDFTIGLIVIRSTLARVDGKLTITSPKTTRSNRVLPLTPGVAAILDAQRQSQAEARVHAANLWSEMGLVFTTEVGTPMDPRNVLRGMTTAAKKAGLSEVSVHTLRHSAATAMLESGVHLKAVSELLGHSDIRITGDVYGHVSPEIARAAMDSLSKDLGL